MTATATLVDRLLDVVAATDLNNPDEDFVSVGLALLALGLSKLPPAEREEELRAVENGALRMAVAQFNPRCQGLPRVTNGH